MYGDEGMVIGIMKRRIEHYKLIVQKLMNKQEISGEDKEFLNKEKII